MPESVCFSMIFGNALGRSFSASSNSSWCICFTDPCGSRRKPTDNRNFVLVRPPPAGLVLRSRPVFTNPVHLEVKPAMGNSEIAKLGSGVKLPRCRLFGKVTAQRHRINGPQGRL